MRGIDVLILKIKEQQIQSKSIKIKNYKNLNAKNIYFKIYSEFHHSIKNILQNENNDNRTLKREHGGKRLRARQYMRGADVLNFEKQKNNLK